MDMLHTPNPMAITSTEEIKVATFQLNCASGGDEYHKFVYRMCAFTFGCPNMHIRKFAKNVYHKLNLSKKWHVAQMQIWIEYAVCIYICKRRIYPANAMIEQRQMRISALSYGASPSDSCAYLSLSTEQQACITRCSRRGLRPLTVLESIQSSACRSIPVYEMVCR